MSCNDFSAHQGFSCSENIPLSHTDSASSEKNEVINAAATAATPGQEVITVAAGTNTPPTDIIQLSEPLRNLCSKLLRQRGDTGERDSSDLHIFLLKDYSAAADISTATNEHVRERKEKNNAGWIGSALLYSCCASGRNLFQEPVGN